jgi:hypothetical protein
LNTKEDRNTVDVSNITAIKKRTLDFSCKFFWRGFNVDFCLALEKAQVIRLDARTSSLKNSIA